MIDSMVPPSAATRRLRPGDTCLLVQARRTATSELLQAELRDLGLRVELQEPAPGGSDLVEAARDSGAVLLYQERPGEIPASLAKDLRDTERQTLVVSVAGSWCEGELRTGDPWPEIDRVYWYHLRAWLLGKIVSHEAAAGSLLASINTVGRESASAIIDALQPYAIRGLWAPRHATRPLHAPVDAAVWVGGQLDGRSAAELAEYCRIMRGANTPVLAILDFPRYDEWRLAKQIGVARVGAKPWAATDIAVTLRRLHAIGKKSKAAGAPPYPRLAA